MTTIRARCPDCGDTELCTRDVTVLVCAETGRGEYRFRCPRCLAIIIKPAEHQAVDRLVASGCEKITWALPLELAEPHREEPISHQDLLDFHQALYDETAFKRGLDEVHGEPA